ncbi:MAG: rhodanese-like domain-containing protein, partial [Bacteroidota bacterium]|nr:rhodanese-like domain-containing protein [Bacteroidota bacterium]
MEKHISSLIQATDAKHIIDNHDVVLVDARGGPDAAARYAAAHVPGAWMVNLETDLSDIGPDAARGGRHPLPDPKRFSVLLGNLGITAASHVLVYDDKAGANAAARFWWMMRAAGHQRIQVIDGGLTAIQQSGLAVAQGPPPTGEGTSPY